MDTVLVLGIGFILILFLVVLGLLVYRIHQLTLENKKQRTQIRKQTKKYRADSPDRNSSTTSHVTKVQTTSHTSVDKEEVKVAGIEVNKDFQRALTIIEDGSSVFITGKAGTGKSTLLRYFIETTNKQVAVLAPTGIAALNVKGQTIHSFFRFPPKAITPDDVKAHPDPQLYKNIDAIVIDEISMVRSDLLDGIDLFLRLNGKSQSEPFGGTQIIFFGDLYQLPPVVTDKDEHLFFADQYESPFFFSAHIFDSMNFPVVELEKVYRQTDLNFIQILDAIRHDTLKVNQLTRLNECVSATFQPGDNCITLTPTNRLADSINEHRLFELPHPEYIYTGAIEGNFPEKRLPTLVALRLKKGSQVMFVKNDINRRWVNGTIGKIADLGEDWIKVAVNENGHQIIHNVQQDRWDILRYKYDLAERKLNTEIVGSFKQYPLKLAWAITIHKSQGLTFDQAFIDLEGGTFAHGQAYVALSRCRSLDGIVLKQKFRNSDIRLDNRVRRYIEEKKLPTAI